VPEDHVDSPLEGRRGIRKPENETDVAVGPLVTDEDRLVAVLIHHGDLPLPRVVVERREHLGVPEEFDAAAFMRGNGYTSRTVTSLRCRLSTHNRIVSSGFENRITEKTHSALEGSMTPRSRCRCTLLTMTSREAWLARQGLAGRGLVGGSPRSDAL